MSSIEWIAYSVTRDRIKKMADDGIFTAIGPNGTVRGISSEAVFGTLAPIRKEERSGKDQGMAFYSLPSILISYLGHNRPPSAGEIDMDDGVITMLIQIIDRTDRSNDNHFESYLRWVTDIREWLQENPYRDLCRNLGEIYMVHVTDKVPPDNRAYLVDQAQLALNVSLFTRTRRSIGAENYGT